MAELRYRKRSRSNYTPASYTANETATVIGVNTGDLVGPSFCRVRVVFNGGGTDAILIFGDGGDTNRFGSDGDTDETTTGLYMLNGGSGSDYLAQGYHLYTADDTIDIGFTANTSGTRTTGEVDFWLFIAKADPH